MILVIGGTTEGRIAAQTLDAAGSPFYYSTKGDLQEVELYNGERLCGAMDVAVMENFCKENGIKLIVDAAHPFAQGVHTTISEASKMLGTSVVRYERDFGAANPEIIWCRDYREAQEKLEADGITSLLALTGVNTISKLKGYWGKEGNDCLFRVLDREESREIAAKAGFPSHKLLFLRDELLSGKEEGIDVLQAEKEFIGNIAPQAIITKESGASGYFNEKVEAALACGVKVYAVRRPALPDEFITVYGPVGLRMEIERLVSDFFPLKTGLTTGSTATAATRGALRQLLYGEVVQQVYVVLPQGENVRMSVKGSGRDRDSAWGCAVKYSGDDPDVTNGHEIISTVRFNCSGEVRFFGGEGVGIVTLPGLGLEVGGPAINNGPRGMMRHIVAQELMEYKEYCIRNGLEYPACCGVDITISVPGGRELACRTFNPRVGVVDGISIIGTSGVVRPFSKDAFLSSISREMDVANALGVKHLVINSGAKSEQKLKSRVGDGLPPQAFIHYGNFIGETVRMAGEHGFSKVTLGIMIGKAVKLAAGNLDTHSKVVTVDKEFVMEVARNAGCTFVPCDFSLARELWGIFKGEDACRFFNRIIEMCHSVSAPLLPDGELEVVLVEE